MPTIIQHLPSFFSEFRTKKRQFNSLDELLQIDFVSCWKGVYSFVQYSLTTHFQKEGYPYALMAEFKSMYPWFVVGYIDKNDCIQDLPEWKMKNEKL